MLTKIVFGILVGATVGFALGTVLYGGKCAIFCYPYRGAAAMAIIGGVTAAYIGSPRKTTHAKDDDGVEAGKGA
jgi:hypothetical protein